MTKLLPLLSLIMAVLMISGSQTNQLPYRNPRLPVDQRVADLLGRMTLEEKVAQTQTMWITTQFKELADDKGNFAPDQKTRELLKLGLGQFGAPSQGATDAEKATAPYFGKGPRATAIFTNAIQKYVIENSRLGIPVTFHEEALHGLVSPGATSFPQAIALAGTWDLDLVHEVFTTAALEARSRGAHHVLAPVVDLARDPRWGRMEETYGEDPYLVSRMGVAAVQAFQGNGPTVDKHHVVATLKHFAAHGQPESGTNVGPGNFSNRLLREVFLYPFEVAVKEGRVMSVMPSYNEIDGLPSHANKWLLQKVLRDEWGFNGLVVSDYFGINELMTRHNVAVDQAAAAKRALEAGVDMELPQIQCNNTLLQQIKDGVVAEATLDKAVGRILKVKFLLGLFEDPYVDPAEAERVAETKESSRLALRAAHEAITLLKNENNLMPLDRNKIRSIAVIGPNAGHVELGEYSGGPTRKISILQGIKDKVGGAVTVNYAAGCKITTSEKPSWHKDDVQLSNPADDDARIAEAVKAAQASDVAVVVVGDNVETTREGWAENHLGDRDSLDLLGRQNDLVKAIVETGKPVIVFLIGGRALSINYIAEKVPAIFQGWYLGQETGVAVADVLFGDVNPSGKLPITIPRNVGQVPDFYYHKPTARRGYLFSDKEPLFAFGHGLSYTTFAYANLKVSPDKTNVNGQATVTVDITNSGKMTGDEIVQMYVRDDIGSVTRPVKELKGFARISLRPGETKNVQFAITPDKLSFLNEDMQRVVEPGTFTFMVGSSSRTDKLLTAKLEILK
jgi:beta-glucosidase